jgi:hypothetical protein
MPDSVFEAFKRFLGVTTDRRTALRSIAGGVAVAAGTQGITRAKPPEKIDICHYDAESDTFRTMSVPQNAFQAHLAHGDTPGECAPATSPLDGVIDTSDVVIPAGSCNSGSYYDTYTFWHPGGFLSLSARGLSSFGTTFVDPVLYLFAGDALPTGDFCTDSVASNDDHDMCTYDAYIEGEFPAGMYRVVLAGWAGHTGNYVYEVNGFTPPPCGLYPPEG